MAAPEGRYGSLREQIEANSSEDFGDLVYHQLKNAPWILCSVGVHLVVALLLWVYPWTTTGDGEPPKQIQMAQLDDVDELEEDVPPEIEETKPIEEQEKVTEEPVIKDAKVSDHNETDNDVETEESLGDPRFNSDAPFEGPCTNGTFGIGGGAGGAFGGRRGGHRTVHPRPRRQGGPRRPPRRRPAAARRNSVRGARGRAVRRRSARRRTPLP